MAAPTSKFISYASSLLTSFETCREYIPQNIMYDKRVARGSTHAAMVIPAGSYPDTLFQGTGGTGKKGATGMKRGTGNMVSQQLSNLAYRAKLKSTSRET